MTAEEARKLGFSDMEINAAWNISIACNFGKSPTIKELMHGLNVEYQYAYRIKYLMDLMSGRKEVNVNDIRNLTDIKLLAKHFRKINPGEKPLTTEMLSPTRVSNIPKIAVIRGITDTRFTIFNSNDITNTRDYYRVEKTGQSYFILRINKNVPLTSKIDKDGIIEIMGRDTMGILVAKVKAENVRLCNRYMIVASLRLPGLHNGMYAMITASGDIVYIYAKTLSGQKTLGGTYSERVYDYGIMPHMLKTKLGKAADETFNGLNGLYCQYIEPMYKFELVAKSNRENRLI